MNGDSSSPTEVNEGAYVTVNVSIKYVPDGSDCSSGSCQVLQLSLRDDDIWPVYETIKSTPDQSLGYLYHNTWKFYSFSNIRLSDWDDGGNGIELYIYADVEDPWANPDAKSAIWRVTVQESNQAPSITRYSPSSSTVTLDVGESKNFEAKGTDPDNNINYVSISSSGKTTETDYCQYSCGYQYADKTYSWSSEGTYRVTGKVVDDRGEDSTISWTVTVIDPRVAPTISINTPPSPKTLNIGTSQSFSVIAHDNDGDIDYLEWTLSGSEDDSLTDSCQYSCSDHNKSYSHTFNTAGSYTLTAKIVDDTNKSASTSWSITVQAISSAWWSTTAAYPGQQVKLYANVSGFAVNDQLTFTIFEDDIVSDDQFETPLYGNVYLGGDGNYYAVANWIAVRDHELIGEPEYFFEVCNSDRSVCKKSSKDRDDELKVVEKMQTSQDKGDFEYSPGDATDGSDLDNRIPVILVHGNNGDEKPATLNYWYWWLEEFNSPQYNYRFKVYRYIYDSNDYIASNGNDFATFINNYPELNGKKILILAHSMGGLVARYALNTSSDLRNKTVKLITLGTPHLGSPGANPTWVSYTIRNIPDIPLIYDPINMIESLLFFGYSTVFDNDAGSFDLAWHDLTEIPESALSQTSIDMINAKLLYSDTLLSDSLESPFTDSQDMQLTIGDQYTLVFGGYKIDSSEIIGGGNSSLDEYIDDEVGSNHSNLASKAVPLMKLMPYKNGEYVGNNDGMVPLKSALIEGHFSVEQINLTSQYSEDIDHSTYLDVPNVISIIMDKIINIEESFKDNDNDGYSEDEGDCDDSNSAVNPGATEICDDIDNNCVNGIDEGFDSDDDGYKICEGDCDDSNSAVNPGATEICDNTDNNCVNGIDEGFNIGGTCNSSTNSCGDYNPGSYVCTSDSSASECNASQPGERSGYGDSCVSPPNNCGDTNTGVYVCATVGVECNAITPDNRPLATAYTDSDNDAYGDINSPVDATCGIPSGAANNSLDCNDNNQAVNPGVTEGPIGDSTCSDSLDNDCDGYTDLVDADCSNNEYNLTCTDAGNIECLERTDGGNDSDNIDSSKPKVDIEYEFRIVVRDSTGSAPQYVRLYMAQRNNPSLTDFYSYEMSCTGDYGIGATCTYTTLLGPAVIHKFYFEAEMSDGVRLRYPDIVVGYITGPEVQMCTDFNLVGIPRDLTGTNLDGSAAFGTARAYRWDADLGYYTEVSQVEPLKTGEGYFVLKEPNTLPEHESYEEIADAEYTYELKAQWNIISSPYAGNVKLSDIQVKKGSGTAVSWTEAVTNGWLVNAIYYYNGLDWGGTYSFETEPDATLVPWMGYWINLNMTDDTYYLVIPKPAQ